MKRNYISEVLRQFFKNNYSKDTQEKVQKWLLDENHAEEKETSLNAYWEEFDKEPDKAVYDSLHSVKEKLGLPVTKVVPLRRQLLRIAAVLLPLLLLGGGFLYLNNQQQDYLVEITVPYGERQQLILPDGSEVWLNAGSSLYYPETFSEGSRTVKLKGEASFSVSKSDVLPFIVETGNLSVKVLGTVFNVKAYPEDESITTTLNRGKVSIQTSTDEEHILEPDQQLSFSKKSEETVIQQVIAEDVSSWKNGDLVFNNASLEEIIPILERYYNVTFIVEENFKPTDKFTGKFQHKETINIVLDIIKQVIVDFDYTIQNNKVLIKSNEQE